PGGAPGPALQHRQGEIGGVVVSEELVAARAREIEQRAKAVFERCVTLDLAANITDDAAKPRAQKLQFPPRCLKLVSMHVTPHRWPRLARRRSLWRSSTPSRSASSTSFSIARWVSRASVGCAIAFSWTVVSIATRSRSLVSIAPVRWATERLSCNSAA